MVSSLTMAAPFSIPSRRRPRRPSPSLHRCRCPLGFGSMQGGCGSGGFPRPSWKRWIGLRGSGGQAQPRSALEAGRVAAEAGRPRASFTPVCLVSSSVFRSCRTSTSAWEMKLRACGVGDVAGQ